MQRFFGKNERGADRQYPRREHIGWTPKVGQTLRRALVTDESTSGIGLVVDGPGIPAMGGTLEVASKQSPQLRTARIVRVGSTEAGRTRIGCRWVSSKCRQRDGPELTTHNPRRSHTSHTQNHTLAQQEISHATGTK